MNKRGARKPLPATTSNKLADRNIPSARLLNALDQPSIADSSAPQLPSSSRVYTRKSSLIMGLPSGTGLHALNGLRSVGASVADGRTPLTSTRYNEIPQLMNKKSSGVDHEATKKFES